MVIGEKESYEYHLNPVLVNAENMRRVSINTQVIPGWIRRQGFEYICEVTIDTIIHIFW